MTPLQREALQMCLEYIETDSHERRHVRWKINEALAEPQQEPVAWIHVDPYLPSVMHLEWEEKAPGYVGEWLKYPLYTSPPAQRKPLTDADLGMYISKELAEYIDGAYADIGCAKDQLTYFARTIEAAHGIKGDA